MEHNNNRFCEVTLWWSMYYIQNQVSPHFFYYPAELMRDHGFDVDILTKRGGFFPEKNADAHEVNNGLHVSRLPESHLGFSTNVFKHIVENKYSLVHLQTVDALEDFSAWAASTARHVPMVYTQHSPDMETIGKRTDIKARIARANWKLMNSDRCVFIAYTRWQESFYRGLGIKNIRIIPHGIDPGVFDVERSQSFAFKYNPEEHNILCVGNIDPRKGQHYLIESMPAILKEFPRTKLFLVGRAFYDHQIAYKKRLEEEIRKMGISDHVVFINDAPRDELIQLYKWSDVFAFPTDAELFSIVILEALAAGLPIIATDRPYIREPLQDGKAGVLVSRDTKSFRDGIIELLGDKVMRDRISANERKAVDEKYHLKKVVDAHWDLYRSLLEQ